jgi:hypothetical protein
MAELLNHIFRWDLDKTYLVSHFESLRGLLAVPFERGHDKIAVPGVSTLIRALREGQQSRGSVAQVFFLSASPPQIGAAIRDKLEIDGIEYEGITFKDQVGHLVRGRFDAIREQIGYKLDRLLAAARETPVGAREYLFGDDWESDPYVYSMYADLLDGRIAPATSAAVLERAGVHRHYKTRIGKHLDWLEAGAARHRVAGIYILRQRKVAAEDLAALGPRLTWFDNYFECALALYAKDLVDQRAIVEVVRQTGLDAGQAAASFSAAASRPPYDPAYFEPIRRRLVSSGLMAEVASGKISRRLLATARRWTGRPSVPCAGGSKVPSYVDLVDTWSRRGRKDGR